MKDIKERKKHNCKVFYLDLFGKRELKYAWLWNNTVKTAEWKELKPAKDAFYYVEKDFSMLPKFKKGIRIDKIFNKYCCGIVTSNDKEIVSFYKENKPDEYLYNYRPFDVRYIDYNFSKVQRPRYDLMQHLTNLKTNKALIVSKQFGNHKYFINFITNILTDKSSQPFAPYYLFPLYLIQDKTQTDNFTKEFSEFIRAKYKDNFSPEQILGYIYAVLHSPAYRTKYEEMLKIDFPSIPFTGDEQLFLKLSGIGSELIEHHLLNREYENKICRICGDSENYKVEKCEYDKGKVWFNKDRYFEPVPEHVWNFYIGGYQVLDKWLKERKKHSISLTSDDIRHFIKVVNVLDITIRTAEEIDQITKDWI